MDAFDDELTRFAAEGPPGLPTPAIDSYVDHGGARIWHATVGEGLPVVLLHGGLGHSGNWGYQVPALLAAGYRVILIDTRGHGRSTRDDRPFTYELLAADVRSVLDALGIERAAFAGWSDGACIALILAMEAPERVSGVFYFACNMDPSGTKEFVMTPEVERCFSRHAADYAQFSATPDDFKDFVSAVSQMQETQPNATAGELASVQAPVAIVHAEHDEFIKLEHAEYLARTIPGAQLVLLPDVSHFAPLQRPEQFNATLLTFLAGISS